MNNERRQVYDDVAVDSKNDHVDRYQRVIFLIHKQDIRVFSVTFAGFLMSLLTMVFLGL